MTLIEILFAYRSEVERIGREKANVWIEAVCSKTLWRHIKSSVSDKGEFIDAEGDRFQPY